MLAASLQNSLAQSMALQGKFDVNAGGAATYAIPIAVPPGTADMHPALSLEYTSQGANGIVGVGGALGGLPAVTRCPQTMAQDGVRGSVNFDGNDRFCLDGQRLMAISGAYGSDGTEYRTEIESFVQVISHGAAGNGPAWFEVHTKSGQIMEFGHTADSQLLAQGKTTARVWAANKVADTAGNYYTVRYTNDPANGQDYPAEIDYTGNAAAGVAPYNKVQFAYATRPDIVPAYQAGSLTRVTVLLTEIKAYAGATLVNDYKLTYQQGASTQRSRLTSVTLCYADGSCQPGTSFGWQEGGSGYSSSSWVPTGPQTALPIPLDIDGDGKTDFIQQGANNSAQIAVTYISKGDGTFTVGSFNGNCVGCVGPLSLVADVNGDGKSDLIYPSSNGGAVKLTTLISNGDGTFKIVSFNCGTCLYLSQGAAISPQFQAVDLNGDGRTDLVQPWNNGGTLYFITYISNGDGTFTVGSTSSGNAYDTTGQNQEGDPFGPRLLALDLNGDGKTDLVQQWNNGGTLYFLSYLSNGDGTFTAVSGASSGNGFDTTTSGPGLMIVDLNADGKFDLIQQWNNGGTLYFINYLSQGDGTFKAVTSSSGNGYNSLGNDPNGNPLGPRLVSLDVNGDGRSDVIQQGDNSGTLYLISYLSNGDGTFRPGMTWSPGTSVPYPYTVIMMTGDYNGDGLTDFTVSYLNSSSQRSLTNFDANPSYPDVLTTITTGLGARTSVAYQPLSNGSNYQKDTGSVYPIFDVQGSLYVVSRVDTSNGLGGILSATYGYAGGKIDINGRGFLGYRQVTTTDLQAGIVQTVNYRQDFPYIGLIASTSKISGSVTLNQATNAYGATALGGTRNQVMTQQSVAQSSDLDGSSLPTVTTSYQYDGFGNVTQMMVATSDGFSKTTNNTYNNDAVNWFLGRLASAIVTSAAPTPAPPPTQAAPPDMTISLAQSGSFQSGQIGAAYVINVGNTGTGSSSGTVIVADSLPTGLTATAISGAGWACTLATLTCTRGEALAAGSSFPPITLTVNVASVAAPTLTNIATVSGGGETNTSNDTATLPTTIIQEVILTIAASANNLNLWSYLLTNGYATAGVPANWIVTIASGVVIGSSSSTTPAFDTGAFPAGSTLRIINNGNIAGTGGSGGAGGSATAHAGCSITAGSGSGGGPALQARVSVTIANNNAIWGGGGGGGGGSYSGSSNGAIAAGGGGGGGAGALRGNAGAQGSQSKPQSGSLPTAGSAGALSSGGAGGQGGVWLTLASGGVGGQGGNPGQPGSAGGPARSGSQFCNGAGSGGAAGPAVIGNSFITWNPVGDVRGALN